MLQPIFRNAECVYDSPSIHDSRDRTAQQLAQFHEGIKRFVNPHTYPVGLESALHEARTALILAARK